MFERLSIHQAAKRTCGFGNATGEQRSDLVEQASLELLVDATRDPLRDLRSRKPQCDGDDVETGDRRFRLAEMGCQRFAREDVHLESAYDAFQVARLDPGRRAGVHACEHPVQALDAAALCHTLEARAQIRIATRSGEQTARQSAVIQPRAAHHDWQPPAPMNVADDRSRVTRVLRGRVLVGRIRDIDQVMRNAAAVRRLEFVSADIEPAVDRR